MSDTLRTDALREVVIGQYKEDELTGNGMGNILSALTDIETLERERDEWAELWADLSRAAGNDNRRLEREREELKNQLIDAKSSTAFWMGKYNNAVQLRGKDPLCDSFWKTLDKLAAERALADRLADCLNNLWHHHSLTEASYDYVDNALAAWKEARSE